MTSRIRAFASAVSFANRGMRLVSSLSRDGFPVVNAERSPRMTLPRSSNAIVTDSLSLRRPSTVLIVALNMRACPAALTPTEIVRSGLSSRIIIMRTMPFLISAADAGALLHGGLGGNEARTGRRPTRAACAVAEAAGTTIAAATATPATDRRDRTLILPINGARDRASTPPHRLFRFGLRVGEPRDVIAEYPRRFDERRQWGEIVGAGVQAQKVEANALE